MDGAWQKTLFLYSLHYDLMVLWLTWLSNKHSFKTPYKLPILQVTKCYQYNPVLSKARVAAVLLSTVSPVVLRGHQ